ncbi:MAG TPA: alpha amylase C-terminal domain-containing protein, partial [Kiloniellaceae bacterium]|nr:alpha amylase C-terminal domain-containing protein [Kiloniellaceae bacterium]
HQLDCDGGGFRWIDASNAAESVIAYLRLGGAGTAPVLVVVNFTPEVRRHYRLGVPEGGRWREILNTDSEIYGGSNVGNGGGVTAAGEGLHGQPNSVELTLPPLAALFLTPDRESAA